jgi:hypothetical protein
MNGIKQFRIKKDEIILEDLQVDPHYDYMLLQSNKIDENTILVPFRRKSKVGFAKIKIKHDYAN